MSPAAASADVLRREIRGDDAQFELFIPRTLIYFDGHFPGIPLLPGLVQVQWAIDFASTLSGLSRIRQINRLKFTALIRPDTALTLTLQYNRATRQVNFRYHQNTSHTPITFSQGYLLYRD